MIERPLKPKRRCLRLLLSVFVCALVAFIGLVVYIVAIVPPSVPRGPVRMVRGTDGRLEPAGVPEQMDSLPLAVLAARTRCTDSLSSSASTTSSGETRFACRRILVVNRSDHLLMQRVGPSLLEHLANLNCTQEVDYSPDGRAGPAGGPAPDLVVTLEMPSVHESGGLTESKLTATIVATAGNCLAAGPDGAVDRPAPPTLQFHWTATLEHESITRGITSRSAKYRPQAEDIAGRLGGALVKLINGYYTKYGPMPPLPAAFYPAYTPTGPLPFLDDYRLQPLASWHGLMVSNDSYWRLSAPSGALADIRRKLRAGGWRVRAEAGGDASTELRAVRGDAALSIFPAAKNGVYYVHYVLHMSRADFAAAVDATITDSAPTDLLLLFSKSWSDAQRTRALGLLRTRPLATADADLSVAEMCQSAGREGQARESLARAAALMLVTPDTGELDTRARSIAGRLDAEKVLKSPPTRATLLAAGFAELTPGVPPFVRELALGQPVFLFIRERGGKLGVAGVRVVRSDSGTCQVAYVDSGSDDKSWGRTGEVTEDHDAHLTLLGGRADITVSRRPARDQFLLTARALVENP